MDAGERSRKRREMVAPREEPESVPPPARRRKVRNELDPEVLWDKETDEPSDEYETDEEGLGDSEDDEGADENVSEDLDDWDHPIRRLKIN
jgi:phosphopantothenoylcysteine synthetase/decarboxylase